MPSGNNSEALYEPIIAADDLDDDVEASAPVASTNDGGDVSPVSSAVEPTTAEGTGLEDSFEYHTPDDNELHQGNNDNDGGFEALVATLMRDMDYMSVNKSAMNLSYAIFNAGLTTIPVAAFQAGMPLYSLAIVSASVISAYVTVMIIRMANQKQVKTLEDLAEVVGGQRLFLAVSMIQFCLSFSMMCITLCVWAAIMSDFFRHVGVHALRLSTRQGQVFWGAVLILPFTLFKQSMISIRWSSYFSVVCIAVGLTALTTANLIQEEFIVDDAESFLAPKSRWWLVVFVMMLCYSYNQRGLAVYRCMRARSTLRWQAAVRKANIVVSAVYIFFGLCGYLTSQRLGVDQFLCFNFFERNSMKAHRLYFDCIRVIIACCLLLTLPIDSLIASATWRRLWRRLLRSQTGPHQYHRSSPSTDRPILSVSSSDMSRHQTNMNKNGNFTDSNDFEKSSSTHEGSGTSGSCTSSLTFGAESSSGNSSNLKNRGLFGVLLESERNIDVIAEGAEGEEDETVAGSMYSGRSTKESTKNSNHNAECRADHRIVQMNKADDSSSSEKNDLNVIESSTGQMILNRGTNETNFSECSTVVANLQQPMIPFVDDVEDQRYTAVLSSPVRQYSMEQRRRVDNESAESCLSQSGGRNGSGQQSYSYSSSKLSSFAADFSAHERATLSTEGYYASYEEYCAERAASAARNQENGLTLDGNSATVGRPNANFRSAASATGRQAAKTDIISPLFLWICSLLVAMATKYWLVLAVIVSMCTVALMFIIPTMIYFRMKLSSDFQATPLCKGIVPNRLYMTCVQVCGVFLFLFLIFAVVYSKLNGENLIKEYS